MANIIVPSRPLYDTYVEQVSHNDIPTCEYVKQAVNRHVEEIARSKKDFDFYFNRVVADRYMEIIKSLCHTQDKYMYQPFNLQPWQAFIFASKWAWLNKETNYRRFRRSYEELPRKQGKSEMGAVDMVIELRFGAIPDPNDKNVFHFIGTPGAEVYSVALVQDQAKKCMDAASVMFDYLRMKSPYISKTVSRPTARGGIRTNHNGVMKVISRDRRGSADGLNPSLVKGDEVHSHNDDGATVAACERGVGSRPQSLISLITTAGIDTKSFCYRRRGYATKVLSGSIRDDVFFCYISTIDEGDDWTKKESWIKANPNWDVSIIPDNFERDFNSAYQEGGSAEINFKIKALNLWQNTSSTWIPDRIITARERNYNIDDLKGRRCYGGIDLAHSYDLSVLSLFFPSDDVNEEPHLTLQYYWIPEDNMIERVRRDNVPYEQYCKGGWIVATEGNVTDYDYIELEMEKVIETVDLRSTGYDRHFSARLVTNLTALGFDMRPQSMRITEMSTPTKDVERMYRAGEIANNGNPVTRWCYSNVTIRMDANENISPDKAKSSEKIDGAVADIIAYNQYRYAELDTDEYTGVGVVTSTYNE